MMAMMGMGGGAEKTFAPHTDSDAYELISPRVQGQQGDVLRFYADISSGWLNVQYKLDGDMDWRFDKTYITADSIYFIAPLSGVYQFKFTGSSVSVDDFLGFRTPLEEITIIDDQDNSAVLQQYDGQTVNVKYDRVLSATEDGNGGWKPTAYSICLPYDFDFKQYCEDGQVTLYRMVMVDDYYHQFIFTNDHPVATAGMGYLAVINFGSVNLSAKGVKLIAKPMHEEFADYAAVYSYKDYKEYNAGKITGFDPIGTWRGTFQTISNEEASAMAAYGIFSKKHVKLISSDTEEERTDYIPPFRAFYEPKNHQSVGEKDCEIMIIPSLAGDLDQYEKIEFPADVFGDDVSTGIDSPVIHVIEADGSHRYFDLQGHQLNEKPRSGIYIKDGKKYSR
jgi:hypothetical protein